VQIGAGNSHDPFRYCLPQKLAAWKKDPLYQLDQKIRARRDLVLPPLGYEMGAGGDAADPLEFLRKVFDSSLARGSNGSEIAQLAGRYPTGALK
jgi:hypothetical protein